MNSLVTKYALLFPLFLISSLSASIYDTTMPQPTSLILFALQDNQLTIERYSLDEINPTTKDLPTRTREGHRLYSIDLSEPDVSLHSVSFYPKHPQYITITADDAQKPDDYVISWLTLVAPSLAENKKELNTLKTVHFSVMYPDNNNCVALAHLNDNTTLELHCDYPIKALCGAFVEDVYFEHDRGLFTRTLTKRQLDELGIVYKNGEILPEYRRIPLRILACQLAAKTLLCIEKGTTSSLNYMKAKWNTLKEYFAKRKQQKRAQETLQKSFDKEEEFDMLLEQAMDDDLDFIKEPPKKDPSAATLWFQKAGAYLLFRYIAYEKQLGKLWHWILGTQEIDYTEILEPEEDPSE